MSKEYIGDGVYVDVENGMLKLTAENGIYATDTIYLEREVYAALVMYVNRLLQTVIDATAVPEGPAGPAGPAGPGDK